MGLAMVDAIQLFDRDRGQDVNMRVGIHTGMWHVKSQDMWWGPGVWSHLCKSKNIEFQIFSVLRRCFAFSRGLAFWIMGHFHPPPTFPQLHLTLFLPDGQNFLKTWSMSIIPNFIRNESLWDFIIFYSTIRKFPNCEIILQSFSLNFLIFHQNFCIECMKLISYRQRNGRNSGHETLQVWRVFRRGNFCQQNGIDRTFGDESIFRKIRPTKSEIFTN